MRSVNNVWENKIYSKGRQLNNYPYDLVVSLIARFFFSIPLGKRKNIKMLDLGCGAGNNSKFLAENGFEVYGIDGSDTAIRLCRKKFKSLGLNGSFIQGDFLNLPYSDIFFDCVLDRESLYANKYAMIIKTIEQIHRKLKSGGLFICFMYNNHHPEIKLGRKIESNTYSNFRTASGFHNAGIAHFTNLNEIKVLFNKFKVDKILRNTLSEVGNKKNKLTWLMQYDEYIIIARK